MNNMNYSFKLSSAKWLATIKICWSRYLAYRTDFFLQVIGPAFVLFFVQYNLWTSIFENNSTVNGFNLKEMLEYHLWSMIIMLFGQGHMAFDLSNDIRMGKISSYLIYPFDFWKFHTANFISFQLLQFFICAITLLLALSSQFIVIPTWSHIIQGISFIFLVSIFWFTLQFLTGILAFWLEETWILRVIAQILTRFLSGAIIPLDFFPTWARNFLDMTPFPLLSYYPIKILSGKALLELWMVGLLLMWTLILILVNRWIWKRGVRLYTAAGM